MLQQEFDTIVFGLGAMGCAAVYQLAKRGHRVMGLDQFSPPHERGSSHGETRIIRQAIGEGAEYVPLALRSYELWREIEREAGSALLTITGGLILESPQSTATMHGRRGFLARTSEIANRYGIRHEILEARDLRRRYPQFAVTQELGYFEPETGYLKPEACIRAQLELAKKHGAIIYTHEKVLSVDPSDARAGVVVNTSRTQYRAHKLVIAAGSWLGQFLAAAHADLFKVYRQVMFWFDIRQPRSEAMRPGKFPIFIWILGNEADSFFYGFPSLDGATLKVASEQYASVADPEKMEREVSPKEKEFMFRQYVRGRLPGVTHACDRAVSCLYTTTPDRRFVVDFHPAHPQVLLASPCSGHGFKHSAAIGEVLAELVIEGKSKIDISRLGIGRFNPSS